MKQNRYIFLFAVLLVALVSPYAYAQNTEAVKLYQKGKNYEKGTGVDKNPEMAIKLYLQAAEMGLDSAQNKVGYCYEKGIGVYQDEVKAIEWYRKAADQGYAPAQCNMGRSYKMGWGGTIDEKTAVEWFQKAASQDYVDGIMQLAVCYYSGSGVPQDYQKAKELYEKVLEKNPDSKNAKTSLQRINKKLEEQKQSMAATTTNVDVGIPVAAQYDMNTFAVIIGNEKYAEDDAVLYAENDAKIFKEYVQRTFGVPENQINYVTNAGLNKIRTSVRWLAKAMEVTGGKGRAIFYFAGHGIPDEASKTAYLLPVDGYSNDIESAYPLERLYQELGSIPAERITVFLDACFNGAKREGKMLASARGVAIKVKPTAPQGHIIVFSASQNDETAYAYQNQKHGMFTYYLLKKLQETKGDTTLGELSDYLTTEVKRQAFADYDKKQTPTVIPSQTMIDSWKDMKLR
ncbi:MAG: SEL1-like repeat protein [Prevotella sp.]|nr:SEL1-like repeat protein [Prevotella sp.]